jgi:hypothetical protein
MIKHSAKKYRESILNIVDYVWPIICLLTLIYTPSIPKYLSHLTF